MTKPQIATILNDGTYGQRDMTDEEHKDYLVQQQQPPNVIEDMDNANRE